MLKIFQIPPESLAEWLGRVVDQFTWPLSEVDVPRLAAHWVVSMAGGVGVAYGAAVDMAPAGFLLGLHTNDLISGQKHAVEYLWMVGPNYRASGAGLALLDEFEKDARAAKCHLLVCGCNRVYKMEKMRNMYLALGFTPFSEAFSKPLVEGPLYPETNTPLNYVKG